ncbi:MAG: TetR/AcrR family transcriptional regulator [Acidimicrobiales bacterium]
MSTTVRRRVEPPEVRRDQLFRAAIALFAATPPSQVSIADITARAGVATGSFYRFFATKDQLLVELRGQALGEFIERAAFVAASISEDWWAATDALVEAMMGFWFEDPDRARVVLGMLSDPGAEALDTEHQVLRLLSTGLRVGQDLGVVGDIDPDIAASLVLHGALGLVYHAIVDEGTTDPAALIAEIQRQLRRLLAPAPTPDE